MSRPVVVRARRGDQRQNMLSAVRCPRGKQAVRGIVERAAAMDGDEAGIPAARALAHRLHGSSVFCPTCVA